MKQLGTYLLGTTLGLLGLTATSWAETPPKPTPLTQPSQGQKPSAHEPTEVLMSDAEVAINLHEALRRGIDRAALVANKGQMKAVQNLAKDVKAHATELDNKLTSVAKELNIALVRGPGMQGLPEVAGQKGEKVTESFDKLPVGKLDRAFVSAVQAENGQVLHMLNYQVMGAADTKLRALINEAIPVLIRDRDRAAELLKEMGARPSS